MLIFLVMNSLVILSAYTFVRKLLKIGGYADFFIALFLIYLSQIILTELALGGLGKLYLTNILFLNIAIFLIIWLIPQKKPVFPDFKNTKDLVCELLGNKYILSGVSTILAFGLVKILINLINPPFGWDSLNYHFTFPVEWLKHGNLNNPITVSDDPSPPYYPITGSLFYFWLILPFKTVFLADLGQMPFFVIAFLAVYGISRKIGVHRIFSLYAAILFCIIPNFFKQLSFAYVDIMVGALFLTSAFYLILLNEDFSFKNILLFGVSLGLLLGTKTVALLYCLLLLIPFSFSALKNIKNSHLIILAICIIVMLGGFGYLRNFLETANPFYPLNFKLAGKLIFKGAMTMDTYRAHFTSRDYRLTKLLFSEGLGAQSILFILPAVFLSLPVTLFKKKKQLNFTSVYFLILPFFVYLVYRYVIPLANTRYLYPLLGIGMILGFYFVQTLSINRKAIDILAALCIVSSMAELAKRQELIASALTTLLLLFSLPLLLRYFNRMNSAKKRVFIFIFSIVIIAGLSIAENLYAKNEFQRYKKMIKYSHFWPQATVAWEWLNANTDGNNIAYVGRPVPFPLYGSKFKNNVYYISVNKTEPAKLHYFKDSLYEWGYDFLSLHKSLEEENNYRGKADFSVWLTNLYNRGIDYLFIYSLHQTTDIEFPLENEWAKSNPHRFIPVFENSTIHIYKLSK